MQGMQPIIKVLLKETMEIKKSYRNIIPACDVFPNEAVNGTLTQEQSKEIYGNLSFEIVNIRGQAEALLNKLKLSKRNFDDKKVLYKIITKLDTYYGNILDAMKTVSALDNIQDPVTLSTVDMTGRELRNTWMDYIRNNAPHYAQHRRWKVTMDYRKEERRQHDISKRPEEIGHYI